MNRVEMQIRSLPSKFETRAEDGSKYIEGYFAVFNQETELFPGAFESVAPEAMSGIDGRDVRGLANHDTRLVMGRTKAGTMTLRTDTYGLYGRIRINENDTDALNLYARVERGDVDQCSFGFEITSEETEWRDDGTVHWRITGLDLHEVSVCTFPAYEGTSVQAREAQYERESQRRLDTRRQQLKERMKKLA